MKTDDFFPSNYLKATDLKGEVRLTINHVERKEFEDNIKPVLHFRGAKKGLILNLTNFKTIVSVHGDETDNWPGKEVIIFPAQVPFRGQIVPAVRVKVPTGVMRPQAVPQFQEQTQEVPEPVVDPFEQNGTGSAEEIGITDDDIPF